MFFLPHISLGDDCICFQTFHHREAAHVSKWAEVSEKLDRELWLKTTSNVVKSSRKFKTQKEGLRGGFIHPLYLWRKKSLGRIYPFKPMRREQLDT